LPKPKLKNVPASIRQKLLNLAHERNQDLGLVLTKYALERILFRISKSKFRDVFVLKGALLFELWTHQQYRPTRDADFLATGNNSPERFVEIFREISTVKVEDDGLRFDPNTVKAERIKEDADYEGVRVTFTAVLDKARIPIQIDVGFGDVITPGPIDTQYPTLLDLPAPRLLAYPRETVVSEKLEAIVKLGIANSRMKDFHDLHSLSVTFELDGQTLTQAVRATFERRHTELPTNGIALEYSQDIAPARGISAGGKITLLPGQSPAEEFSTLAHEVAHEMMHRTDRRASASKRVRETEAEAVAFVICNAIGLDTGSAAQDYIGLYGGDAKLLAESMEHIQRVASEILNAIGTDVSTAPPC